MPQAATASPTATSTRPAPSAGRPAPVVPPPDLSRVDELHRQADVLRDRGVVTAAGLDDAAFHALVEPLAHVVPGAAFVLVLDGGLVPAEQLIALTDLRGGIGFTTMDAADLARFRPTADVAVPDAAAYLLVDVDAGEATRGVTPDAALPQILAAGRTPLTLAEGLAVVLQHPQWLRERTCFEMLGSRAGDKRVTGLWVSKGAPRLGWCWGGNPHTWLGMATAAGRVAPPPRSAG